MPRHMSFFHTIPQILEETKTVTRRLGWWFLQPGDLLWAVEKGQGLKKGERAVKMKLIRVVSARIEPLGAITKEEIIAEGFPELSPAAFLALFGQINKGCEPDTPVNRIEFAYEKTP
jgi:hypothetical protein